MTQEKNQQPWYLKIISTRWRRVALFTALWFTFWIGSTKLYSYYIHDVGATYWSVGIWGYPIVFLLFVFADKKLSNKKWSKNNPILYTFLLSFVGLIFYPLALYIILWSLFFIQKYIVNL